MDKEMLFEKLRSLELSVEELKVQSKRAKENISKSYLNKVKYLVTGISYAVTDLGQKLISLNEGKIFNNVILEKPINARDVFVKLGETKIIPGGIVPYLKQLITMVNEDSLDVNSVIEVLPSIEEYIFYLESFLKGRELGKEEEKDRIDII